MCSRNLGLNCRQFKVKDQYLLPMLILVKILFSQDEPTNIVANAGSMQDEGQGLMGVKMSRMNVSA
jgi:hypothetical protein